MDKAYEAKQWEGLIYSRWEKSGFFNPDNLTKLSKKTLNDRRAGGKLKTWSCIMPPPNATGVLHVGHVMMVAYQDALTRYWRLRHRRTLWLPGTDHAAIATQTAVEKKILKEGGPTRQQLGRTEFLRRVDDFVQNSQNIIHRQLRATGASVDWSREAFTLDPARQQAVRAAFKKLFDDGLIYRGERVINWCPRCQSTLADDEVNYADQPGQLYTIQYGPLQVATTRPETKLGDTGAAVNPRDERYKKYVGQNLTVDLAGHKIKIKVVADREVDMNFGTGVVGVTPAHSPTDERLARRHQLPMIKIINEDGTMTAAAGHYANLTVTQARQKFLNDLRAAGQLIKVEDIQHAVGTCYRCQTPIEPLPKKQWFVAVDKKPGRAQLTLKQLVSRAVKDKKIIITPDRFTKDYLRWASQLHDWCISRQIWYGHRIPAYYYPNGEVVVTDQQPTTVMWIRHGATALTEKKIIQGCRQSTNTPLSAAGRQAAVKLAAAGPLRSADIILSSPLIRAKQTADILGRQLKLKVMVEPLLTERDYGQAEGQSIAAVEQQFPAYAAHRRTAALPQAETADQLERRTKKLFAKIAQRYPGQTVICVTHNGLLRSARHLLTGQDMETTAERVPPTELDIHHQSLLLAASSSGSWQLRQDEDTLDTWFSSALWTFSTLGWPSQTKDLTAFHPTDWMETAYDILNLWVSRMVMMSEYFLHQAPFKHVYLHGIVRDDQGRKMSKSLGNGIDPLEVIPTYGADALRLALMAGVAPGNDLRLSTEKIAGFRNFANKLWNISRFILTKVSHAKPNFTPPRVITPADAWILSRFSQTLKTVSANLEKYQFSQAITALHAFTWDDLADWYLEVAKLQTNPPLLTYLLTQLLIIWHPFCPFVTEAIWSQLTKSTRAQDLLMVQRWPAAPTINPKTETAFTTIQRLVLLIRSFKQHPATAAQRPNITIKAPAADQRLIDKHKVIIETLSRTAITYTTAPLKLPKNVLGKIIVYHQPLPDSPRQAKQLTELRQYIAALKNKLADRNFLTRAPAAVIAQQRQKLQAAEKKLQLLE